MEQCSHKFTYSKAQLNTVEASHSSCNTSQTTMFCNMWS